MADHDPFDLEAQKAAKEEAEKLARTRALLEGDDLKWLMGNKRGRRFVYRILERAGVVGVLQSNFNMNALKMAFNDGLSVEGKVMHNKIIAHCPEFYALMLKEHSDAE